MALVHLIKEALRVVVAIVEIEVAEEEISAREEETKVGAEMVVDHQDNKKPAKYHIQ